MKTIEMPFINIRDLVIYPDMEQSLFIGRKASLEAIAYAIRHNKSRIVAITQKVIEKEKPLGKSDMHSVGVICKIKKSIMMSDGAMKVHLHAEQRMAIGKIFHREGVRIALGTVMFASGKDQKLDTQMKREMLELLVRWDPSVALDDEEIRLKELKKEERLKPFLKNLLPLVSHRKPPKGKSKSHDASKLSPRLLKAYNMSYRKRQKVLEEGNCVRQLAMVKEILQDEIVSILGIYST